MSVACTCVCVCVLCQMFDVYLRAYKDTRLAKQLTKQIIDNMLSRLHIGGRAFAERSALQKMFLKGIFD